MTTLNELRSFVLALPDTTEGTHFRLEAFRVSGKPFVVLEKDHAHVLIRLDPQTVRTWVSEDPATFAEVWQSGKFLIGIRFALEKVPAEKVQKIVELSWRTKALKKLILSYDESQR